MRTNPTQLSLNVLAFHCTWNGCVGRPGRAQRAARKKRGRSMSSGPGQQDKSRGRAVRQGSSSFPDQSELGCFAPCFWILTSQTFQRVNPCNKELNSVLSQVVFLSFFSVNGQLEETSRLLFIPNLFNEALQVGLAVRIVFLLLLNILQSITKIAAAPVLLHQ